MGKWRAPGCGGELGRWQNRAHVSSRLRRCPCAGHRIRAASTRPLRDPADRGLLPLRQLPGCGSPVGGAAGRPRRVLLRGRPARDHGRVRPEGAAGAHPPLGRAAAGRRDRPGPVDAVRPVARARARPARLGARLPDRVRRGQPDDPVQGQVRQGRSGPGHGRVVHLPDPAGRGHPDLPGRPGPGRRGPAPAPGADPRPGAALQPPVRQDLPAAGAVHRQGDREDLRPAGAGREDEQVVVLAGRHHRPAGRPEGQREEDPVAPSPTRAATSSSTRRTRPAWRTC